MRIISGKFRRKKLISVPGMATRPTTDRIRESVFNIIAQKVPGKKVLDLFAGTGALGLEAISRGAASCVFIDSSRASDTVVRKNIAACGITHDVTVLKYDILKDLHCLKRFTNTFNLVFMDPPYAKECIAKTLENLKSSGALEDGATLVIEHCPTEPPPSDLSDFEITDRRHYGKKTEITFMQYHKHNDSLEKGQTGL